MHVLRFSIIAQHFRYCLNLCSHAYVLSCGYPASTFCSHCFFFIIPYTLQFMNCINQEQFNSMPRRTNSNADVADKPWRFWQQLPLKLLTPFMRIWVNFTTAATLLCCARMRDMSLDAWGTFFTFMQLHPYVALFLVACWVKKIKQ